MRFAAGLALGAALGWMAFHEPFQVRVSDTTVRLSGLPPALEGLRILHLSDLHCGPWVADGHLRRGVARARELRPDLAVITGDFLSVSALYAPRCGRILEALDAPLGVWGVLGNHDYWTRRLDKVRACLEGGGVRLLTNESVRLQHRGQDFWLCGVDDVIAGRPDARAALAGVPEEAFRLVLCHEPDHADEVAAHLPEAAPESLQLSGHSHGGQVLVPGLRRPFYLPPHGRRYPAGLHRVPGAALQVYTNVGLGIVSPPFRLGCPPEVGLLTLAARPATG